MKKIILSFFFLLVIGQFCQCKNPVSENTNATPVDVTSNSIDSTSCSILFIGSSYFNANNLPEMFRKFCIATEKSVSIQTAILNGLFLSDHAKRSETSRKISEKAWDYVLLQGVGRQVAYPDVFEHHPVLPALKELKTKISSNCDTAQIVFCLPWAFEDGMTWVSGWTDDYFVMQSKIYQNTLTYADEIGCMIAPVGWAWNAIMGEDPPLHYLFQYDYNHPSLRGSYLMACVIYTTLFGESTEGIAYTAGLLKDEANHLQVVASQIVLDNLVLWNLEDSVQLKN